jgi:membrane-associated progesterone receptor component
MHVRIPAQVFDVTPGRSFYGPEGGYKFMAGKDASRALALMSLDIKDVINSSLDDLPEDKIGVLDDWVAKYHKKYTTVGWMGDKVPATLQEEQVEETEQTDADGEAPSQL